MERKISEFHQMKNQTTLLIHDTYCKQLKSQSIDASIKNFI